MSEEIRIVQFIKLTDKDGTVYRYQNYFINETKTAAGIPGSYGFAPFQVNGGVSSLNGDNIQIQLLFPADVFVLKLVEKGDGNRKSQLTLDTRTVNANGVISDTGPSEQFVGLGASFSEDTVELRFNTAADSVASNFPAQRLNQENVGVLPLDSVLSLR